MANYVLGFPGLLGGNEALLMVVEDYFFVSVPPHDLF